MAQPLKYVRFYDLADWDPYRAKHPVRSSRIDTMMTLTIKRPCIPTHSLSDTVHTDLQATLAMHIEIPNSSQHRASWP